MIYRQALVSDIPPMEVYPLIYGIESYHNVATGPDVWPDYSLGHDTRSLLLVRKHHLQTAHDSVINK